MERDVALSKHDDDERRPSSDSTEKSHRYISIWGYVITYSMYEQDTCLMHTSFHKANALRSAQVKDVDRGTKFPSCSSFRDHEGGWSFDWDRIESLWKP